MSKVTLPESELTKVIGWASASAVALTFYLETNRLHDQRSVPRDPEAIDRGRAERLHAALRRRNEYVAALERRLEAANATIKAMSEVKRETVQ